MAKQEDEIHREENESVGEQLKKLRTAKGVSIEEAAEETKVSASNLRALETDNYEALPADTFIRGQLGMYAAYLGIDGREITERFFLERDGSKALRKRRRYAVANNIPQPTSLAERSQVSSAPIAILILVLLGLIFAGYCYYASWNPLALITGMLGNEEQPAATPVQLQNPPATETPQSGESPEKAAVTAPPETDPAAHPQAAQPQPEEEGGGKESPPPSADSGNATDIDVTIIRRGETATDNGPQEAAEDGDHTVPAQSAAPEDDLKNDAVPASEDQPALEQEENRTENDSAAMAQSAPDATDPAADQAPAGPQPDKTVSPPQQPLSPPVATLPAEEETQSAPVPPPAADADNNDTAPPGTTSAKTAETDDNLPSPATEQNSEDEAGEVIAVYAAARKKRLKNVPGEKTYSLQATFTENTWVQVTLDGEQLERRFFMTGDHQEWEDFRSIQLVFGRPDSAVILLNGETVLFPRDSGDTAILSIPDDIPAAE